MQWIENESPDGVTVEMEATDELGLIYVVQVADSGWDLQVIERRFTYADGWDDMIVHTDGGQALDAMSVALRSAHKWSMEAIAEEDRMAAEWADNLHKEVHWERDEWEAAEAV